MKRDTDALSAKQFDLAVIGGGIYGACIARDAALRGMSVALVEKNDFCSGTSHNSLKIIHSGLRYLQHLDFRRIRESIVERRIWLSIAPHLVSPLKFIIPTQGHLTRGPLALQAGLILHRLLGLDWNRGVPDHLRIPLGRVSGRKTLRLQIPGIPMKGLSGAASWYDGQVIDTDRLVLECLQSAAEHGAVVANYVAAESLMHSGGRVHGLLAVDRCKPKEIEIKASLTINAAGPWVRKVLQSSLGEKAASCATPLARNLNIVIPQLLPGYGVGIPSKRKSDALIGSEARLFFVTPWKNVSVIGTTHFPYDGEDPDSYEVSEQEICDFVEEINDSWPHAKLSNSSIYYVYSGLTPADPEAAEGEASVSRHAEIIDHASRSGCEGLISVIGVKYTTARLVAERVVSLAQRKLGCDPFPQNVRTALLPGVNGGSGAAPPAHGGVPEAVARAIDLEMAINLDDFLIRRNDVAARGGLTESLLRESGDEMGRRLGWDAGDKEDQYARVLAAIRYAPDRRDG